MSPRRGAKVVVLSIMLIALAVATVVFMGPRFSYGRATREDTPQAYRRFLSRHARGPLADQARRRLADTLWREATATRSAESYEAFASECPTDPRVTQAREKARDIAQDTVRAAVVRYQGLKTARMRALAAAETATSNALDALLSDRRRDRPPSVPALLEAAEAAIRRGDLRRAEVLTEQAKSAIAELPRYADRVTAVLTTLDRLEECSHTLDPRLFDPGQHGLPSVPALIALAKGAVEAGDVGRAESLAELVGARLKIGSALSRPVDGTDPLWSQTVGELDNAALARVRRLDQDLGKERTLLCAMLKSQSVAVRRVALSAIEQIVRKARPDRRCEWEFSSLRRASIEATVQGMATNDPDEKTRDIASELSPILHVGVGTHQ